MKCSVCKKECEKPITKVDMSFDLGVGVNGSGLARYGAADWDDKKAYCGEDCMMLALRKKVHKTIEDFEDGQRVDRKDRVG